MLRRTAVTAALLALLLPAAAVRAEPRALTSADLPRLTQELADVTGRVEALTSELEQASALDGGLRVAYDRADVQREASQAVLDARAREVYMAAAAVPLGSWLERVASPEARFLARRGQQAALRVDQGLLEDVSEQAAALVALQRRADSFRVRLLREARPLLAAQEHARVLLDQATALAATAHAAEVQALLAVQRTRLDDASATATLALAPGQQGRARRALEREAPVIALLEASGSGYPSGYVPTGVGITGSASWYGPGFVGNPTASGAPYDPERLTCAHKSLPLGTVLRVSRAGLAVSCLVNDRGPYVGDRVLDMSRAGSRALGYSGVATVAIEVLAPTG